MKGYGKWIILAPLMAVLFGAAITIVVMELWNWLMPELFGLDMISFWQALGLLVLSKILFGGFRFGWGCGCGGMSYGPPKHYWKKKFKKRMKNMSADDREKWEERFGAYCGQSVETPTSSSEETSDSTEDYSK